MKKYKLNVETTHLDSSSFHVHGEYEADCASLEESEEPQIINITYGYSLLPQTRSQAIHDGFNLHFRRGRAFMDENRVWSKVVAPGSPPNPPLAKAGTIHSRDKNNLTLEIPLSFDRARTQNIGFTYFPF